MLLSWCIDKSAATRRRIGGDGGQSPVRESAGGGDEWADPYYGHYEEYDEEEDSEEDYGGGRIGTRLDYAENIEEQFTIKKLVDLNGVPILKEVTMSDPNLLQEEFFSDEPDDHEEIAFTGNEVRRHAPATCIWKFG